MGQIRCAVKYWREHSNAKINTVAEQAALAEGRVARKRARISQFSNERTLVCVSIIGISSGTTFFQEANGATFHPELEKC